MNTPRTIYNFLSKLESVVNKNLSIRECFTHVFELNDTDNFEINRLRLKLTQNIYELVEFIQDEQAELEIDHSWANEIINILTFPLYEDQRTFLSSVNPLYPHAKNFLATQIFTWDAFHGKVKPISSELIQDLKAQTDELIT